MHKYLLPIITVIFAYGGSAGQEIPEVLTHGAIHQTDEFTGVRSCYEVVVHVETLRTVTFTNSQRTGIWVSLANEYDGFDHVFRVTQGTDSRAITYLRFADGEVLEIAPNRAYAINDFDRWRSSDAAVYADADLALRLLQLDSDLRVRFEAGIMHHDFTMPAILFQTAATGFGQECLDL